MYYKAQFGVLIITLYGHTGPASAGNIVITNENVVSLTKANLVATITYVLEDTCNLG